MKEYPELKGIELEGLFLDNTFCNPKYVFPPQQEMIQEIVNIVRKEVSQIIN